MELGGGEVMVMVCARAKRVTTRARAAHCATEKRRFTKDKVIRGMDRCHQSKAGGDFRIVPLAGVIVASCGVDFFAIIH